MIGIQLVAVIFALWMIYFSYLHYRRKEFSGSELVLWQLLWVGLLAEVIFPSSTRFLLATFSITRTFDLMVIVGIVVLFGITFRNYVIVRRLERKMEEIIRIKSLQHVGDAVDVRKDLWEKTPR